MFDNESIFKFGKPYRDPRVVRHRNKRLSPKYILFSFENRRKICDDLGMNEWSL